MLVIILERTTPGLRGELTRWLLEIQAGIFVGAVSALVRDKLWEQACAKLRSGAGLLIHTASNEQGFLIRAHGATSRLIEDYDGLLLSKLPRGTSRSET